MSSNSDHSSTDPRSTRKANKDLTPQERTAKRKLKKELKMQQKRARLESRLRHAITRNDTHTEQETRKALEQFHSANNKGGGGIHAIDDIHPHEKRTPEREFVLSIFSQLQLRQQQNSISKTSTKQEQTDQAVELLRNMTKGTQSRSMFKNVDAIHGYTRQKFFERAMLVALSFAKLKPADMRNGADNCELRLQVWKKLKSIRRICSIGCGPGNDAVGVLAFLKAIDGRENPQLEHALLLDWAMNDWKLIVDPLSGIVVPNNVQTVDISTCDVSKSLLDAEANLQAKEKLLSDASSANVDLFLISYLLTEIRGKWDGFLTELIKMSKPDTLYYFAEPTPWQLHRVKELFGDVLDFIWLDSSMDEPEMQPLDNRLGPGVLLGKKRAVDS